MQGDRTSLPVVGVSNFSSWRVVKLGNAPVFSISENWRTKLGKLTSDLVLATGLQLNLQQPLIAIDSNWAKAKRSLFRVKLFCVRLIRTASHSHRVVVFVHPVEQIDLMVKFIQFTSASRIGLHDCPIDFLRGPVSKLL